MARRRAQFRVVACLLAGLSALVVRAGAEAGVTIQFDYSYDTNGLFSDPARREVLELAAAHVNRFIDALAPIVPSETNHWEYYVVRPNNDPNWDFVADDTIPADTIKVYVGGRELGSGELAKTYISDLWTATDSQPWRETIKHRGQPGSAEEPATDYAPFAATIVYDLDRGWHFRTTADGLGDQQVDLLTVTMHELYHVFGLGPADSWQAAISDGRFTGPEATAVGSSNNPELTLDATGGHWQQGTLGIFAGQPQLALLGPQIDFNDRRWPTDLDRAALRDVGWEEAMPGDVDLDRDIDGDDIQQILAADVFEAKRLAVWATGDFDGDNLCTGDDIQAILATGLFGQGPYAGTSPLATIDPLHMGTPSSFGSAGTLPGSGSIRAVPEPATHLVLASGAFGLVCWVAGRHRRAAGRGTSG